MQHCGHILVNMLMVTDFGHFSASINGEITDINMVNVSVVRSSSAQRSIVDSISLRTSSNLDSDSQHRRTSSFPENMAQQGTSIQPGCYYNCVACFHVDI